MSSHLTGAVELVNYTGNFTTEDGKWMFLDVKRVCFAGFCRNQLCINTSIVYMHRFYMFHSFKHFHRNVMAPCFLFLGAKVEEQPRKLEHVLKVAYRCLHKDSDTQLDNQSDEYMQMAQDLIDNESILLQTLGFELSVEHPHTFVVKCAQMVKAAKDLAQTSYFLATNSLHLTTFCIEQKPTVVACVCIYVACKWTSYEIPESHDKKHWWEYMDNEVTLARIEEMTSHFIKILDSCPTRLKKKISTGPVIYKGGTLQLKREDEDETGAVDKHNGASSSKTSSKAEEKGNSTSTSEKQHIKTEQSSDSSKIKERKEHASSSHGAHRHPTHQDGAKHSDLERKHADHQKHRSEHKHRHSEHSKHKSELSRHEDVSVSKQIAKKRPDMKDNEMKMPEIKSSSSISRPTERTRTKEAVVDEPSAAAKMILSLPPLQHKHSLSEHDLSSSESPAKKKKLDSDALPTKKPKLDLDSSKVAGHPKAQSLPSSNSSHQKRHKSSHSKGSSSKDKHKEKLSSDKHPSLHQHKQQSSHKSSHGQKHHSKLLQDQHPGKLSESDYGSASDISINESPKKHISGLGLQKEGHDVAGIVSRPLKPIKTPQKSNSDPSGAFMKSMRTPQKSQGHLKSTSKNSISLPKEEISLPPPPPPPSVDVMSLLNSPPNEMFSKQTSTPSKGQSSLTSHQYKVQSDSFQMRQSSNQVTDQLPQSSIKDKQATSLLNQPQLHLVQPPHGILPMPPSGIKAPHIQASQPYQQQGQFISTSQAATSAGTTYGITPMYFQGQESQTASSNLGFGPSSRNASMFSPQAVTLPPPPLPPPGMILTQVRGLPPPPPLNLPFPPPT